MVARHVVDGIVLSTANIYFTVHDDGARVFRTAQSATPGQEAELCHEPGCRFGDIVFAKVDDVFYGYFFALASGMTTIRRIPLAPQPGQVAEIIGPAIADIDIVSSHGNLVTDGSFLYWQSDTAVNRMPVRGGSVTVLDRTPLTRPVAGLHLVGPTLIYAVDRVVHHVPKDGSAVTGPNVRVVFTAAAGVVAHSTPQPGSIYVAERNGAIEEHSPNGLTRSGRLRARRSSPRWPTTGRTWPWHGRRWPRHGKCASTQASKTSHSRQGRTLALPCSTPQATCTGLTTMESSRPAKFKDLPIVSRLGFGPSLVQFRTCTASELDAGAVTCGLAG
jgi:hypothetical protein